MTVQGDSARFAIFVFGSDGDEYRLQTGDKVVFAVKHYDFTEQGNIFSVESDSEHLDDTGRPVFVINAGDTNHIAPGEYVYDVKLILADGTVDTVVPIDKRRPFIVKLNTANTGALSDDDNKDSKDENSKAIKREIDEEIAAHNVSPSSHKDIRDEVASNKKAIDDIERDNVDDHDMHFWTGSDVKDIVSQAFEDE